MKIAIYINNKNISGVDCTKILNGNPGIGGTEYCILLLAQVYKTFYPQDKVILLASKNTMLQEVDDIVETNSVFEAVEYASKCDILIISAIDNGNPLPQSFFDLIEKKRVKTIIWGHNYYLCDFCDRVARCDSVKANVFVGRQQYDRYVDHAVIKKSTYIYNFYPMVDVPQRGVDFKPVVTYIGSLVPLKGFQVLAAAWKDILAKVPDAQLNVIGSGLLYNRNAKLGRYGIAEEYFENEFMKELTDENGNILSSVHFLGVMGTEKRDVILKTSVGVVNPTGRTETFGISALDFESCGVPVVTIAKGGFLDTVIDGNTGLLYHNTTNLAACVAQLLIDRETNIRFGKEGIRLAASFAPESIISEWHDLFEKVCHDEQLPYKKPDSFMNTNLKWFRCTNRAIKDFLHLEYPMSVIGLESFVRNLLRSIGK